jgi:hypothetical protein
LKPHPVTLAKARPRAVKDELRAISVDPVLEAAPVTPGA